MSKQNHQTCQLLHNQVLLYFKIKQIIIFQYCQVNKNNNSPFITIYKRKKKTLFWINHKNQRMQSFTIEVISNQKNTTHIIKNKNKFNSNNNIV